MFKEDRNRTVIFFPELDHRNSRLQEMVSFARDYQNSNPHLVCKVFQEGTTTGISQNKSKSVGHAIYPLEHSEGNLLAGIVFYVNAVVMYCLGFMIDKNGFPQGLECTKAEDLEYLEKTVGVSADPNTQEKRANLDRVDEFLRNMNEKADYISNSILGSGLITLTDAHAMNRLMEDCEQKGHLTDQTKEFLIEIVKNAGYQEKYEFMNSYFRTLIGDEPIRGFRSEKDFAELLKQDCPIRMSRDLEKVKWTWFYLREVSMADFIIKEDCDVAIVSVGEHHINREISGPLFELLRSFGFDQPQIVPELKERQQIPKPGDKGVRLG